MNKMVYAAVAALLSVGVPAASAQRYYVRPPTNPYGGTGFGLNRLFYGSGFGPGVGVGVSPGGPGGVTNTPSITGAFAARGWAASGETDPSIPGANVTGHPTRFFYYQHYFNNQGGSSSSPVPLTGSVQPGTASLPFGIVGTRPGTTEIGKRPNVSKPKN